MKNQNKVDKAYMMPWLIMQIVLVDGGDIEVRLNPEYAKKLNQLDHDVIVAKITHLISETREQMATIVVNATDFPDGEWLKLKEHDRI